METKELRKTLDLKLAHHCGPALAGIKASNTIWLTGPEQTELINAISRLSKIGSTMKDIKTSRLYDQEDRSLYLIYSEEALWYSLKDHGYQDFLNGRDYQGLEGDDLIIGLKKRLSSYQKGTAAFPHELSCFLGYPAADIRGYLKNKGKNYIFCRYWKVYQQPEKAWALFAKYDIEKARIMRALSEIQI